MKTAICLFLVTTLVSTINLLNNLVYAGTPVDPPVIERTLPLDDHLRYLLIGAPTNTAMPAGGFGLVLILPGGDGSRSFLPFCKEMRRWGLPEDFIAAELIAPIWSTNQQIVWPTRLLPENDMAHSTEEFIEAVIDDVGKLQNINARHVFTLSWSSGGPAAYTAALCSSRITGSFVAMSVFRPEWMPSLTNANGKAFYLYHSPDDQVCPFSLAQLAQRRLTENGACIKMETYPKGHGWQPFTFYFDSVRRGIEWLRSQQTNQPQIK